MYGELASICRLEREFGGRKYRYKDLPDEYKKCVDMKFIEESEYTEKDLESWIFATVEIPLDEIVRIIEQTKVCADTDFKSYHKEYMLVGMENFREEYNEDWPILLGGEEFIVDGWHRFHSYYEMGKQTVKCIKFLDKR